MSGILLPRFQSRFRHVVIALKFGIPLFLCSYFTDVFANRAMNIKDAKYLLAYLVPASAVVALTFQGAWAWLTVVFVFGVIPLLELVAPVSTENHPTEIESDRANSRIFDWLLYLNAPLVYGIVGRYLFVVSFTHPDTSVAIGLTLATGIVVGACGINVAHELGHRNDAFSQHLSKLLLLPALYQHFFIEHNLGHHKNVATDLDPASARKNEILFVFWWRSVTGSWRSAWQLESERLNRIDRPIWSLNNRMIRFISYQTLWLSTIYVIFGLKGVAGAVAIAVVGFLLLETVNYLEHYGLRRRKLDSGHFEPVSPRHSWNSDHEVGRILLYELTRHSDHHYKSTRKYQVLRHLPESPQLPFGYPTSVLLAFVPPLWFAIMNKHIPAA